LFGGGPPFTDLLGKKFAELSLNEKGKVVILFLERDGWEAYIRKYTCVLENNHIKEYVYLPLNSKPLNKILRELISCTGIIIGGGETELYRDYIVDTPIGERIKELYKKGVPVAGFSAGSLICPTDCVISPIDNSQGIQLFLPGLGLIKECVITVHFSKWNEGENLKAAMEKVDVPIGYGIDDDAGLYFANEKLIKDEGKFYTFKQKN
jgi:cyanophycinase